MKKLPQKFLKRVLHYNPETGLFTWTSARPDGTKAGTIAGKINPQGYWMIRVKGRRYLAHRLAVLYMTGEFPRKGLEVDHIDHIKLNNRWINLRVVTAFENQKNRPMPKNNTSGTMGVSWHSPTESWKSAIQVNGSKKNLGYFKSKSDAIAARKEAEIKYGFHKNHGKSRKHPT